MQRRSSPKEDFPDCEQSPCLTKHDKGLIKHPGQPQARQFPKNLGREPENDIRDE
jgi:hypothetical protein